MEAEGERKGEYSYKHGSRWTRMCENEGAQMPH